jgi:hypothetical protein
VELDAQDRGRAGERDRHREWNVSGQRESAERGSNNCVREHRPNAAEHRRCPDDTDRDAQHDDDQIAFGVIERPGTVNGHPNRASQTIP